jgi:Zn-dependent protease
MSVDDWLIQTVSLNMLLAAFNLIPVPPLDGGNVLAGLVPESLARVIDHLRPWGFVIIYVLLFTGVVWRIVRPAQDLVFRVLL